MNNEEELLYNNLLIIVFTTTRYNHHHHEKNVNLTDNNVMKQQYVKNIECLNLIKLIAQLRLVLPVENKCKLSRIETLRTAVNYIHLLSQLLQVDNN